MSGDVDSWTLNEAGPADASRRALLTPGMFCTAAFYDEVLADERWEQESIRIIAATPPGFGGTPLPDHRTPTVREYAGMLDALAEHLRADLVVGHSYFANVAIEMAARSSFPGRLLLIAPCFCRDDEMKDLQQLDKVNRIPGFSRLVMSRVVRTFPSTMRDEFPAPRGEALGAEMQRSDPAVYRVLVRDYFDHLDEHRSLVPRLCGSGVQATVARGTEDEVALSEDERASLLEFPAITLVDVPDAGHFVMTDQPETVADLISELAR